VNKKTKDLAERIKELPPGTKESAAYREFGEGVDRAEFRKMWIAERVTREDKRDG